MQEIVIIKNYLLNQNMMNFNIYKKVNFVAIIFLVILIFEALIWSYGWRLSKVFTEIEILKYGNPQEGWNPLIWEENGIVEIIQEALIFFTILYLCHIYLNIRKKIHREINIFKLFISLKIFLLTYFFLEEISWGQHFIDYKTPLIFTSEESILFNHQKEFNLHNISNFFNEIPRSLVLVWCSFSIILLKLFGKNLRKSLSDIINPSEKLILISIFIIIFTLPDLIFTKFNIIDYSQIHKVNNEGFELYNIPKIMPVILSFNFFRLSELQEFLFVYYFFWHSFFLKQKLVNYK